MLRSQNCPRFRYQPCEHIPHDLTKCLKLGSSITSHPCSVIQLILWPTSGRQLTCGSHSNIKDKSRHTKMSEMCKAKWKWRCGESPRPREHRALKSLPCVATRKAPWMPTFMDLYWGFTKQVYWLNHWPVVTVLNLSALSSPQRCKKFKPITIASMKAEIRSVTERFQVSFHGLSPDLRKTGNSRSFKRPGPWTRARIKYTL